MNTPFPMNMNECLLSGYKLHILQNNLMYSTGSFCTAHAKIIRSTVVKRSLLCKHCLLTGKRGFEQFMRFKVGTSYFLHITNHEIQYSLI